MTRLVARLLAWWRGEPRKTNQRWCRMPLWTAVVWRVNDALGNRYWHMLPSVVRHRWALEWIKAGTPRMMSPFEKAAAIDRDRHYHYVETAPDPTGMALHMAAYDRRGLLNELGWRTPTTPARDTASADPPDSYLDDVAAGRTP